MRVSRKYNLDLMKNRSKNIRVLSVVLGILILSFVILGFHSHLLDGMSKVSDETKKIEQAVTATESANSTTTDNSLPDKVLLTVPFTVQAPNANWDATHEEACEEASLIILKHFLKNEPMGMPDQADQEILGMIKYETDHGYNQDVTMEELARIAKDYYGLKTARVGQNITIDDIKRELAAGHPVIVPAAGKLLDNPNFRGGGPVYHNLVIVGYDKNGFITNDPGTRKGEGFHYTFDNLFNAIHDWNSLDINQGEKTYLVFD